MTASTEAARTPASSLRVPDFFIVGHSKCGTTALYLALRSHPQVFMPAIKEPRFFAPELRSRFRGGAEDIRPDEILLDRREHVDQKTIEFVVSFTRDYVQKLNHGIASQVTVHG